MENNTTVITQKGQVTIPIELRRKFGLQKNTRVRIEESKAGILITPTLSVSDLGGILKVSDKNKIVTEKDLRKIREDGDMFLKD